MEGIDMAIERGWLRPEAKLVQVYGNTSINNSSFLLFSVMYEIDEAINRCYFVRGLSDWHYEHTINFTYNMESGNLSKGVSLSE